MCVCVWIHKHAPASTCDLSYILHSSRTVVAAYNPPPPHLSPSRLSEAVTERRELRWLTNDVSSKLHPRAVTCGPLTGTGSPYLNFATCCVCRLSGCLPSILSVVAVDHTAAALARAKTLAERDAILENSFGLRAARSGHTSFFLLRGISGCPGEAELK